MSANDGGPPAAGLDVFWAKIGSPNGSPNDQIAQILANAAKDLGYCPYCLRCAGLVRMKKEMALYWRCRGCGARCDLRKAVVEVVVRVDGVEVQKLEQHVDRWAVPHVVQAAIVQVEEPDYDGAREAGLAPGVKNPSGRRMRVDGTSKGDAVDRAHALADERSQAEKGATRH